LQQLCGDDGAQAKSEKREAALLQTLQQTASRWMRLRLPLRQNWWGQ
jgi:hypothetical protein